MRHLLQLAILLLLACGEAPAPAPAPAPPPAPASDDEQLEARRVEVNQDLEGLIADLSARGRYDCCIQKPCKQCALRTGGCRCGEALRKGEPVCEECALLWMKGQGAEPVDPSTVRSFLEAEREMAAREKAGSSQEQGATPAESPGCTCGHGAPSR